MITVNSHMNAPSIGINIQESIGRIERKEDYIFAIQLTYRENHTIYHLSNIESINFEPNFLEIHHMNGTCNYYNYEDISEYHVINADDLAGLWGNGI